VDLNTSYKIRREDERKWWWREIHLLGEIESVCVRVNLALFGMVDNVAD
jgi:hypothetical protein